MLILKIELDGENIIESTVDYDTLSEEEQALVVRRGVLDLT